MNDEQLPPEEPRSQHKLITGLVGIGIIFVAFMFLPIPVADIMSWGAGVANNPFAVAAILVLMAVTMSLGLPGSMCFWLIAPFHPPLTATILLLVGSLSGALGAYHLSSHLVSAHKPRGKMANKVYSILTQRSDLFTQTALRVLPGFPHVLVNFTCGLLRLPLPTFIFAAVLGLTSKWAVYCTAVYGARSAMQAEESLSLTTLLPLAILGIMLLISGQLKRSPKLDPGLAADTEGEEKTEDNSQEPKA